MIYVCTLMWGRAWKEYGQRFASTFEKYWSEEIQIATITDAPINFERSVQIDLKNIPAFKDFNLNYEKYKKPIPSNINLNHVYKWNTKKWAPQGIAPYSAIQHFKPNQGDTFIWLDADIETKKEVNVEWLKKITNDNEVTALFRESLGIHPEIGFYAMKINDNTIKTLKMFSDYYSTCNVFELEEWHSAYVWNIAVQKHKLSCTDLNRNKSKDPFKDCILQDRLIHYKGLAKHKKKSL